MKSPQYDSLQCPLCLTYVSGDPSVLEAQLGRHALLDHRDKFGGVCVCGFDSPSWTEVGRHLLHLASDSGDLDTHRVLWGLSRPTGSDGTLQGR